MICALNPASQAQADSRTLKTTPAGKPRPTASQRSLDHAAIRGVDTAMKFARFGRLISAIKLIEAANPQISRETAKAIVRSFGYDSQLRWQEEKLGPTRCL